jgi:phosphonate transport system permease protein
MKTTATDTRKTFWQTLATPFKKTREFFFGDTKGLRHYKDPLSAYQAKPKMWLVTLFLVLVFAILLYFMGREVSLFDAFDRPIQWAEIGKNFTKFFTIDWNYFWGNLTEDEGGFKSGVFYNCLITFAITFIATTIAFFLSIPLGILASHKLFGNKAYIAESILILIRTFPELLLALFLIGLSGYTTFTAILALSLHSIGMVGKLYADQIDEADLDALEALDACGANKMQRITKAVLPQVFPSFLSVGLYRLDINIRTGTMLGLIIQQYAGIGWNFLLDYRSSIYSRLGTDTLGVVLLIIIVDLVSSLLRKKLV